MRIKLPSFCPPHTEVGFVTTCFTKNLCGCKFCVVTFFNGKRHVPVSQNGKAIYGRIGEGL